MKYISLLFILAFVFFPESALALDPLFTCHVGSECNFCDLANMIENVADWTTLVATLIAVIGLMYSGFRMSASRGDVQAFTAAKQMFGNIAVGLVIIMTAWIIVDTIVKALAGGDFGVWNSFDGDCGAMFAPGKAEEGINLNVETVDVIESPETVIYEYQSSTGVSNVSSFSGNLVTYDGHQFDENIISQVNYISRTYGLRVSGGHRTKERNAAVGGVPNSLHLSGRAADFVGPRERMEAAASWARGNGAKEVLIHDAGSGTHLHVGW